MKHRNSFRVRPILLGYWTIAAVMIGMILAGSINAPADLAGTNAHEGATHVHAVVEVDPENTPTITIRAERDALSGWNIYLDVENFTFAPEMVNQPNVTNVGHAHLHLNGLKVARLYGTAFHLSDLPEGQHTITVTLNTNDHSDLALDGMLIEASVVVDTTEAQVSEHPDFSSLRKSDLWLSEG
jgi:hypothetical protein